MVPLSFTDIQRLFWKFCARRNILILWGASQMLSERVFLSKPLFSVQQVAVADTAAYPPVLSLCQKSLQELAHPLTLRLRHPLASFACLSLQFWLNPTPRKKQLDAWAPACSTCWWGGHAAWALGLPLRCHTKQCCFGNTNCDLSCEWQEVHASGVYII